MAKNQRTRWGGSTLFTGSGFKRIFTIAYDHCLL